MAGQRPQYVVSAALVSCGCVKASVCCLCSLSVLWLIEGLSMLFLQPQCLVAGQRPQYAVYAALVSHGWVTASVCCFYSLSVLRLCEGLGMLFMQPWCIVAV